MSSQIIPNICPKCGAPTIDDRCEDNCGWVFAYPQAGRPLEGGERGGRKSFFDRFLNIVGTNNAGVDLAADLAIDSPADFSAALPSPPPVSAETEANAVLAERVAHLENRIKSADQLSKYLLNELDQKLAVRVKEQESLIGIETEKAVHGIKPLIETELQGFIVQTVSRQAQPVIAGELEKIDAANAAALKQIVTDQVDRKLVDVAVETQIEQRVADNFKENFAQQFQQNLDKLLLTEQDYVEIKKKVVSRSANKPKALNRDRLWYWLSGTSVELLAHCPESEVKKYQALGISMLMPMLMGYFACWHLAEQHFTSDTLGSEALIGLMSLVWTLFIMAIDRILLVSYRVSGKWPVKLLQFGWRFFIALLFALIFDASFLPTLYHSDVQAVINSNRKVQLEALDANFNRLQEHYYGLAEAEDLLAAIADDHDAYERVKAELETANANIKTFEADRQHAIADAACEFSGGPACRKGVGAKFTAAKIREDAANLRLEKAKLKQEAVENKLQNLYQKSEAREKILADLKAGPAYHDRKARAEAEYQQNHLDILASNPREETKIVFDLFKTAWASGDILTAATFLAYLILFILVDTFPIIMKILMPRGMYDNLLEAQDQALGAETTMTRNIDGNIVSTGFRQTDMGFEITEITARFAANKSYTAWQIIQQTLETQLDQYIRASWKSGGVNTVTDKSGFAVYTLCTGLPPLAGEPVMDNAVTV